MSGGDTPFDSGVAIVGMAGRFPQAPDLERFWENLRGGVESISFFPDADLLAAGVSAAALRDPAYVRAGGVLDGVDLFDAPFFGMSAREAALLDPQQRLFLECSWEALEASGYDSQRIQGAAGVYAGASTNSYYLYYLFSPRDLLSSPEAARLFLGSDKDFLATRTSYKLGLRGPSLSVQTACSTSLVAVHLACQSLLSGECDMALAGGVSVRVPQRVGYFYQPGGILSPDGHCRAFDAEAGGSVIGSGVGVVVLKRLEDALADGDPIRAVIRGSAVNNDGSLRVGYTAPSVEGQAAAIAEALALARVEPETVTYVEAHGSGTPLGDPIEIAALSRALEGSGRKSFCAVGSVKTNIGHLDAAAGVAGLIKTVLALEHRELPPSLNFRSPNPDIDFDGPCRVNAGLCEWTADGAPRRAGVSSFGMGGTNAHVVLEEAPEPEPSGASRPWQLLLLSAASGPALEQATDNLARHLETQEGFADVAWTLQIGRRVFSHRRALVCRDAAEARQALAARDPGRLLESVEERTDRQVAFLFPGMGEEYAGMARGLYETEPVFRAELDRCFEILEPLLGRDLREVLFPEGMASPDGPSGPDLRALVGRAAAPISELNRISLAQPVLFAVEYALARLWMAWGIAPRAMLGYSLGEYVAACLAGVMSLPDALRVVTLRARLIEDLPAGAMLAVSLPEDEARALAGEELSLSAVNGPGVSVLAGPAEAVAAAEERLAASGVACRRVQTSHAFHSALMRPLAEPLARLMVGIALRAPEIPYLSTVAGTWITAGEATDPAYWVRHLLAPVRF
ncbi:MAG TPA: type I polyketide synthase, partial [Thermoanaerobaculia bacterium]|nr:type I polyketide synthase [Thermoanaerobaculia bacterium]